MALLVKGWHAEGGPAISDQAKKKVEIVLLYTPLATADCTCTTMTLLLFHLFEDGFFL
jgi:hypothetical protein